MDYRLPSQTAALLGGASGDDASRLEGGARDAFNRYLLGRMPWLLLVGAAAGLLVAGPPDEAAAALGHRRAAPPRRCSSAARSCWRATRPWTARRPCATRGWPPRCRRVAAAAARAQHRRRPERPPEPPPGLPDRPRVRGDAADQRAAATGARRRRAPAAGQRHPRQCLRRTRRGAARRRWGEPVDAVLLAGDVTDRGSARGGAALPARVRPPAVAGALRRRQPRGRAGAPHLSPRRLPQSSTTRRSPSPASRSWAHPTRSAAQPQVASDVAGLAAAGIRLDALLASAASARAAGARPRRAPGGRHHRFRAGRRRELVVAYGNDHVAGVISDDGVVQVDAGPPGHRATRRSARRPRPRLRRLRLPSLEPPATSRDVYTYQLIDFSRTASPHLVGVTTVSYAGGGRTVVTYTPFRPRRGGARSRRPWARRSAQPPARLM